MIRESTFEECYALWTAVEEKLIQLQKLRYVTEEQAFTEVVLKHKVADLKSKLFELADLDC